MILILLSLFFCWLFFRELINPTEGYSNFTIGYMTCLAALAVACAWPAIKTWRLENFLSEKASIIAERPGVTVECNSIFGSIADGHGVGRNIGTAYISEGKIVFEQNWCSNFMQYLDEPQFATGEILYSMTLFTHEVMHIKGERNEQKTECQAVQRNHTVGELLGVPPRIARRNAERAYKLLYNDRHPYFTKLCAPGGKYDERLPDAVWQ